jgi:hypothetical protein
MTADKFCLVAWNVRYRGPAHGDPHPFGLADRGASATETVWLSRLTLTSRGVVCPAYSTAGGLYYATVKRYK